MAENRTLPLFRQTWGTGTELVRGWMVRDSGGCWVTAKWCVPSLQGGGLLTESKNETTPSGRGHVSFALRPVSVL